MVENALMYVRRKIFPMQFHSIPKISVWKFTDPVSFQVKCQSLAYIFCAAIKVTDLTIYFQAPTSIYLTRTTFDVHLFDYHIDSNNYDYIMLSITCLPCYRLLSFLPAHQFQFAAIKIPQIIEQARKCNRQILIFKNEAKISAPSKVHVCACMY